MRTLTPKLRKGLPPLPKGMRKLPLDSRGYPIPWFVSYAPGTEPDFRFISEDKIHRAIRDKACWVCGGKLERYFAFCIGPMCAVSRVSAEPPSHVSCAEFSAQACPFLSKPKAERRDTNLPAVVKPAAGVMIARNPGVALVWVTDKYTLIPDANGRVLIRIGNHRGLLWFAEGRVATREEILRSIETGLPALMDVAKQQGPDAVAALEVEIARAMELVPRL